MRISAILAATLVVAAAAPADEKPEAPKRHRGEGRNFEKKLAASFVPPKGWEKGKDENGSYLVFVGPADDGRPSINVRIFNNAGLAIERMAPGLKKMMAQGGKEWKLVDEGAVQIDGKKAYGVCGTLTYDSGDRKVQMQALAFFLVARGKGYTITFTADAAKFDGLRKTFEESAKSFRID